MTSLGYSVYIIDIIFRVYVAILILRTWLQLARADFHNPISQLIVKLTQPILWPLSRIVPSIGSFNVAAVLFAFILLIIKPLLIRYMIYDIFYWEFSDIVIAIISLIRIFLQLLYWIILIRAILSWVSRDWNPLNAILFQLTEPVMAPIRRFIPPISGIDFSALVVFFVIYFINNYVIISVVDFFIRLF